MNVLTIGALVAGAVIAFITFLFLITKSLRGNIALSQNEMYERLLRQTRQEMNELDEKCKRDIAKVEGRLDVLTGNFAEKIAEQIIAHVRLTADDIVRRVRAERREDQP